MEGEEELYAVSFLSLEIMDRGLYHGVYNILWLADLLFVLDLFRKHHHHHPNLILSRSGVWLRPSFVGGVLCWIDEGKGCLALSTFRRRRGRRNITAFLCCVRGGPPVSVGASAAAASIK